MPTTLQKTIDKKRRILIVTKGKLKDHEEAVDTILNKLDIEFLTISLQKCEFSKSTIEWIGFKITPRVVTPLFCETKALQKLDPPKSLQQLRSLMGSIHHLTKFIPILAHMSEPLRPLLKKDNTTTSNKLKWEEKHTNTFSKIKHKYLKSSKINILTKMKKHE